MKVLEILNKKAILPELHGSSKTEILTELAAVLAEQNTSIRHEALVEALLEREKLGSTAIGEGIAIPHGKLPGLSSVIAAFGRSTAGVDFNSLDGSPTKLFFLLVAPEDSSGAHLKALARVSRLLRDTGFRERLLEAANGTDLFQVICEEDDKY